MHCFNLSLKHSALWVVGISAFASQHVNGQYDGSGRPCRGYRQRCPAGYECVKGEYQSTCQQRSYEIPATYLPTSAYTPPVEDYTTPTYPTGSSSYPPAYEPTSYPPGYEPTSYPPGYEPTSYPPGYEPTSYPPDYEPTSYPPGYEPTSYPPGYEPSSYPSGYEPSSYPSGYTPTSYSPGYEPTGYPDSSDDYTGDNPDDDYTGGNPDDGYTGGNPGNLSYTPVVGVPGRVVERRPITVLQSQYADVFNMFVLALEALQRQSEDNDVSYFQLSGIHGWPFISWQYPESATRNPDRGYCTHGSALFLTWHRPYLCLIEQLLHREAVRIAGDFSGSDAEKYQTAADDVRLPYWDWASDEGNGIPDVLTQPRITVVKPEGSTEIDNPLYAYRFQNEPDASVGLAPVTERSSNAESNIAGSLQSRREATFDLFTINGFNEFSNQAEGVHGWVHVDIGDDMGFVPSAAFDPIFWLHHCQVDRIWAMWQATHPGDYMSPAPRSPTFALDGPGPDDLSTPLYPFRHPNGNEWNSDEIKDVEDIFTYGYTYPEVPAGRSGDDLRTYTAERVNELYGLREAQAPSFEGQDSGAPEAPNARREWGANVVVDKEELPGSYRIVLYLASGGQGNTSAPTTGDQIVGVAPIFSSPQQLTDGNRYLNFTVPLTTALVEENIALAPEETVPNLADRLYWVVQRVGDDEGTVPVGELSTLQVAVTSTVTEYPETEAELPERTEVLTHVAPTVGKTGGLQEGEDVPVGAAAPPALDEALVDGSNTTTPAKLKFRRH